MMTIDSIVVIGSKPPPIGGNTIHVQRLVAGLKNLGLTVQFIDYRLVEKGKGISFSPLRLFAKIREYRRTENSLGPRSIVHIHVSALKRFRWFAPILRRIFKNHSLVVTIHSGSFVTNNDQRRSQVFELFDRFEHVICVSDQQSRFLESTGISRNKLSVVPAFLPSTLRGPRPDSISHLDSSRPIITTSGQLLPIYNYEVLLDAVERLPPSYQFVFAFYGAFDSDYKKMIESRISELKKSFDCTIVSNAAPDSFISILSESDVYVRTTKTDGDAVAIREALALGKLVYATNSVDRPDSCVIFESDAGHELADHLVNMRPSTSETITIESNLDAVVDVYERVVSTNSVAHK